MEYVCENKCQFGGRIYNVGDPYKGSRTDLPSHFKKVGEPSSNSGSGNDKKPKTEKEQLVLDVTDLSKGDHKETIAAFLKENNTEEICKLTVTKLKEAVEKCLSSGSSEDSDEGSGEDEKE